MDNRKGMGEIMGNMEKKMAAALAAVSAYMQQEQEAYAEAGFSTIPLNGNRAEEMTRILTDQLRHY